MSKKKRSIRFRMPSNKLATFNTDDAFRKIAQHYMDAERELLPLIQSQNMPPEEAVVLIATYTHSSITGDEWMSAKDIAGGVGQLIRLWKRGLFIPSQQFPYTLEQVQAAMQDDEDRGEDEL